MPPGPVGYLEAIGDITPLALLWEVVPDTDGDLVGYRVYRRHQSDPPEAMVDVSGWLPPERYVYLDTTALQGNVYVYQVRSFDTAGNESENNIEVEVCFWQCSGCARGLELLLPACRSGSEPFSTDTGGFCLPGEKEEILADHTGQEPNWRVLFYHVDHLGTPRVITDEFGDIVSEHAFFPFGEEALGPWPLGDSTNTHWFTGHERDLGVASDYLLARSYRPHTGRFLEADPTHLGVVLKQPLTLNSYGYGDAAPLAAIDPDGLASLKCRPMDKFGMGRFRVAFLQRLFGSGPLAALPEPIHPIIAFDNGIPDTAFYPGAQGGPSGMKLGRIKSDDESSEASRSNSVTVLKNLDDQLMEQAVQNVNARFDTTYDGLSHNCQDYIREVLNEYIRLAHERVRLEREKCGPHGCCDDRPCDMPRVPPREF